MPSLSGRLKLLRNAQRPKLTQQTLADELNISRATYARYETGENEPDINTLRSLAKFHNVSIEYLITGKRNVKCDNLLSHRVNPKLAMLCNELLDAPDNKLDHLIHFWEFVKFKDR
ncbi:helix-turn-helix transcriptional regulator [Bacillus safensis]|uniref:helix-turn-helix domain-containing protein n=1 Tax=Bacillus safensis TaxID=561879 RepID=UPI0022808AFD|nr:helix-turn-helix transcriptional regulator [Bacillus safensis]MCY7542520.1 helix-turn-helix domain-containing protein [Bacillus safensis]MCY7552395.1 helix-turn-helix domain-containing protein [Bacillus safensis]MCY7644826.1 helix-turn-helix domain-containing protein [Bacillus safensis]MCY7655859.1 helix-turn-helix domain-containing protein [Bacillus safensis]MEC3710333.1 helix-turn-helix transcriptional regulator [Bacillus safensis]